MKTIFTAIFGPYDDLKEPQVITPGWQYICFTEQPIKSKVWRIERREMKPEGAARTARYYKIMFHRHIETEFSIWIDASFLINTNLNEWWTRFKEPITCVKHPVRDCAYQEARICANRGKDSELLLRKQVFSYRQSGLPKHNGLIASGLLMRKMNQQAIDLCDLWYQQVQLYSSRDQIGFSYAAWRQPSFHVLDWDYRNNNEFLHVPHIHNRKIETL
jgi:hypothetical protein